MDPHLRNIVDQLASIMSRSHAGLRNEYASGNSKPLIDRIRSSEPLDDTEREYLALLLEGSFGREKHKRKASISRRAKKEILRRVYQEKTLHPYQELSEIHERVADALNADPNNGLRITAAAVEQIDRKSPAELRNVVKSEMAPASEK